MRHTVYKCILNSRAGPLLNPRLSYRIDDAPSEVKTALEEHGGRDAGQQEWIWRWRRCGIARDNMWGDGDGEMGWKNGNRLGKYRQGTTTNLKEYRRSDNLGVRATTDLHGNLGYIWRLCVSYCNLNKTTC